MAVREAAGLVLTLNIKVTCETKTPQTEEESTNLSQNTKL
jgi:hypothetical protein